MREGLSRRGFIGAVTAAGAGVLASSERADDAEAFVSYLVGPEGQAYFASETFEFPLAADVEPAEGLPSLAELDPPQVDLSDLDECVDTIREVGPGGHFLGTEHTLKNFETAFFMPELLDNNSYEQWLAEGAEDANTRGLKAARAALDRYVEPALDPAVDEALLDFIARREKDLPETVE